MLKHRIMTGVAVCVVCFGILFFLPAWTHLFLLLAVFALAQLEWAEMVHGSGHRYEFWATTLCGGAFLLATAAESPLFLDRMAKACAYLQGRDYVVAEDVQTVFADVCAHRVILTQKARLSGMTAEQVLAGLLRSVPVPDGFSA